MWGEAGGSLDDTDRRLLAALRRDGRASVSDLAVMLGVSRATVRGRIDRLVEKGEILGFTVTTRAESAPATVRGQMMLSIEGRATDRIIARLLSLPAVGVVHTTNGGWDLVAEISARDLQDMDDTILHVRRIEGVLRTETNLLLSTRHPAVRI